MTDKPNRVDDADRTVITEHDWGLSLLSPLTEGETDPPEVRLQIVNYMSYSWRALTSAELLAYGYCRLWCHDDPAPDCRVFWGSHGCDLVRGHDDEHVCECGCLPYKGPATDFFGEDAP